MNIFQHPPGILMVAQAVCGCSHFTGTNFLFPDLGGPGLGVRIAEGFKNRILKPTFIVLILFLEPKVLLSLFSSDPSLCGVRYIRIGGNGV